MSSTPLPLSLSPAGRRQAGYVLRAAAVLGLIIGVDTFLLHLRLDPFADVHAYYDAATRLNEGVPLYAQSETDSVGLYLYPPLLAILFRPLALFPFHVAAAVWEVVVIVALVAAALLVRRRIGAGRLLLVLGMLAMPILWTIAIGQAETIVTLLLVIGTPWSVALAGHLKLAPWLVSVYWLGRRDWRSLRQLAIWVVVVGAVQLALEPAGTLAYLRLEWLRPAFEVRNISPYAIHPGLWMALVVGLTVAALRFAPTRAGWPLAVALAVFAYPRLLAYQLTSLLAAPPRTPGENVPHGHGDPA